MNDEDVKEIKINVIWCFEARLFFKYKNEIFCSYEYSDLITIVHYKTGCALRIRLPLRYSDEEIIKRSIEHLKKVKKGSFYKELKKHKTVNSIYLLKKNKVKIRSYNE